MSQLFTASLKKKKKHQKPKIVVRVGRVQIAMGNEHLLVQVVVSKYHSLKRSHKSKDKWLRSGTGSL